MTSLLDFFYLSDEGHYHVLPPVNKYRMITKCSSANRCSGIECPRCARRYARHTARSFLETSVDRIYSIRVDAIISTLPEFAEWRIKLWNVIDHRRRTSWYWDRFSARLWLCGDGSICGVTALGSITEDELVAALGIRWPLSLHRIDASSLFDELYAVVRPGSIMADDLGCARYQPRQMAVRPRRARAAPKPAASVRLVDLFDEPMPMLIG
jgi:hypothetical protein